MFQAHEIDIVTQKVQITSAMRLSQMHTAVEQTFILFNFFFLHSNQGCHLRGCQENGHVEF